ncbi:hypothetical protein [Vibrio mediterranei]|uniref:hypothetical protein n=1 Tax=Vibrio mediterranei TaxID=689 RepID=UPI00148BC0F1|nr:hypothetical protein [Vibrio mediterranei]NOI26352.1 hypothetical protein [Vibrio mediterranei]
MFVGLPPPPLGQSVLKSGVDRAVVPSHDFCSASTLAQQYCKSGLHPPPGDTNLNEQPFKQMG